MAFMGLVSWLLFGLLAGLVARLLLPGSGLSGCFVTSLLGVGGALVGGFLATWLGFGGIAVWDWRGFVVAVLGSLVLLLLHRLLAGAAKQS